MYNQIKEQRQKLKEILINEHYDESKIKIAFETIRQYKSSNCPKSIENKSMHRISQILKRKSIFAIILRETLLFMLNKLETGSFGKISGSNVPLYIEACKVLMNEIDKLLKE